MRFLGHQYRYMLEESQLLRIDHTWVVFQRSFAVRCLDLVRGRVALEPEDLVGVHDGRFRVHVIFNVRHGELCFWWQTLLEVEN